jgi:hypothetical protein
VAGGMNKRGSGVPLGERRRSDRQAPPAAPARRTPTSPCPARHCWVGDPLDEEGEKRPGLLLEWRQGPEGWQGLVVYAARVRPGSWGLVQEWLPSASLTPL